MSNKSLDAFDYVNQGRKERNTTQSNSGGALPSGATRPLWMLMDEQQRQIDALSARVKALRDAVEAGFEGLLKRVDRIDRGLRAMRPEHSHIAMLEFLQKLNRYVDDASIDRDFADNIRDQISSVLGTYGYRIVDYAEPYRSCYDEIPSATDHGGVELVKRAIVDLNGSPDEDPVILRGKVYIHR